MPDEPEILHDLEQPAVSVRGSGAGQRRAMGEGFALAVVLVVVALGSGVLAFGSGQPSTSPSPSPIAAVVSPSPAVTAPPPSATPSPPGRTPAVTPGSRCVGEEPGFQYPELASGGTRVLGALLGSGWLSKPLPTGSTESPAWIDVALGDSVDLVLPQGACAMAWQITLNGAVLTAQDNPRLDPTYASQNRWVLHLPPTTDPSPRLRAALGFRQGWVVSEWLLRFVPAPIPAAYFASGVETISAAPGCGFSVTVAGSGTTTDECATSLPDARGEPDTLFARPSSRVAFRIPGSTFAPANPEAPPACGRVDGDPPDFVVDPGCELGFDSDPSNEMTFVLPDAPGMWWIKVRGCASRDGNEACGAWFAIIDTSEPKPTDEPYG